MRKSMYRYKVIFRDNTSQCFDVSVPPEKYLVETANYFNTCIEINRPFIIIGDISMGVVNVNDIIKFEFVAEVS